MPDEASERKEKLGDLISGGSKHLGDYIALAGKLYIAGESEEAMAVLWQASGLNLSPMERGLLLNEQAFFLFTMTSQKDEALALSERALAILSERSPTPETIVAAVNAERLIAELLWERNRPRAAEAALHAISTIRNIFDGNTCGDQETTIALCLIAARLQTLTGQLEEAARWARRALAQPLDESDRITALVELGCILRSSGLYHEAKSTLEEALRSIVTSRQRAHPRLYHELGLTERTLGHPRNAKEHFEQALRIVNSDSLLRMDQEYIETLYMEIAEVCHELGDHRAEEQTYRDVLAILPPGDPSRWIFRLSLARCKTQAGAFDESREILTDILTNSPPNETRDAAQADLTTIRYTQALRGYESGNLDFSIRECAALLKETREDGALRADLLLLLGHAHFKLQYFRQAREFYVELINSPRTPEYHRNAAKESVARLPVTM